MHSEINQLIEKHLSFDINHGIAGKEQFCAEVEKLVKEKSFKLRFPEEVIVKRDGQLRKVITQLNEIASEFDLKINRANDFNKICGIYKDRMELA